MLKMRIIESVRKYGLNSDSKWSDEEAQSTSHVLMKILEAECTMGF